MPLFSAVSWSDLLTGVEVNTIDVIFFFLDPFRGAALAKGRMSCGDITFGEAEEDVGVSVEHDGVAAEHEAVAAEHEAVAVEHEAVADGNTGIVGGKVEEDVEGISADEEVVGVISVGGAG